MASKISIKSIDCEVNFVEQPSSDSSLQRNNSLNILQSTELSGKRTREMPTFSSVTSPEPDFVTLDDNFNDTTFPYGFVKQQPIVPPSLNDLNLLPNPFSILAATRVVQQKTTQQHVDKYSPQSPEPSEPPPMSTPPMNLSTIDGWETLHTITIDNTFYSEDEPKRAHWNSPLDETFHSEGKPWWIYLLPSPSPPSSPRKMERKLEIRMSSPKRKRVSQHACEAWVQMIPPDKGHSRNFYEKLKLFKHSNYKYTC